MWWKGSMSFCQCVQNSDTFGDYSSLNLFFLSVDFQTLADGFSQCSNCQIDFTIAYFICINALALDIQVLSVVLLSSLITHLSHLLATLCGPRRVPHHDLHRLALSGYKKKYKCRKRVNLPGSMSQEEEFRCQSRPVLPVLVSVVIFFVKYFCYSTPRGVISKLLLTQKR